MPGESDGLSREEFLLVQEQLLQLRNRNYELQEELKRKTNEIQQLSSNNRNDAFQFASKLINRTPKKDERDAEIENLRKKLENQEDEFKLQQSTLFQEMNSLSAQNNDLKKQIQSYSDHPLEKELAKTEDNDENNQKVKELQEKLEVMTKKAEDGEKLTRDLEDMLLENRKKLENSRIKLAEAEREHEEFEKFKIERKNDIHKISELEDELIQMQLKLTDTQESSAGYEKLVEELKNRAALQGTEINAMKIFLSEANTKIQEEKHHFASTLLKKDEEIKQLNEKLDVKGSNELEERMFLLETRYQLELEDLKKLHENEALNTDLKIQKLEEKIRGQEEEKKLALKKQSAIIKELQKSVKEERKRADSYEKKSEEKHGWHVVQESDGNSSHTYDGNESISSLSAIESENVELITKLASLQKINSENMDRILQLESVNSRLSREVFEKGELIENWIREKPLSSSSQSQQTTSPRSLEFAGNFRKLLTNLGQDQGAQDLKEMNKKLQRMLEETLSKNIILQRDIQTLLERTEM